MKTDFSHGTHCVKITFLVQKFQLLKNLKNSQFRSIYYFLAAKWLQIFEFLRINWSKRLSFLVFSFYIFGTKIQIFPTWNWCICSSLGAKIQINGLSWICQNLIFRHKFFFYCKAILNFYVVECIIQERNFT